MTDKYKPTIGLPQAFNYGRGQSHTENTRGIQLGVLRLYFSYATLVAFQLDGRPLVVTQNRWGNTTGKHLNWIDGGAKERRVDQQEFLRLWLEQTAAAFAGDTQETQATLQLLTGDRRLARRAKKQTGAT